MSIPFASPCSIRAARSEDAERVAELAAALATLPLLIRYGIAAGPFALELRELVKSGPGGLDADQELLLAENPGGLLVGLARLLHGGTGKGQFGRGAYLKLIALRPGYEGRGLGRLLLEGVERRAAERAQDLFLLTSDFNILAQRFYARAGYRRIGELPEFVRPGIDEIIYFKRLYQLPHV